MKYLVLLLSLILGLKTYSQLTLSTDLDMRDTLIFPFKEDEIVSPKTSACGTPWLSTGYPSWTNYWSGYMINLINTSPCPLEIHSFEARFQGTSGYRIYTKTGTFVGFETNAPSWTLVGSIGGGLSGLGTTLPTPIPIAVNITIPSGGTQAFYLTRTDNTTTNRHLYITGVGTPGTTIYASDANLSITEGSYIDPYFSFLNPGTRRPSLDVCYTLNCFLPVELIEWKGTNKGEFNLLEWTTNTERNCDYFLLLKSTTGEFNENSVIAKIDGSGDSQEEIYYQFIDEDIHPLINYYQLMQVDFNGDYKEFSLIIIDNRMKNKKLLKLINPIGQEIPLDSKGVVIEVYLDGTTKRVFKK